LPAPVAAPPVERADLLDAAARAADASASGAPSPPENAGLIGRRFRLVLPFGCGGAQPPEAANASFDYDAEAGTLRVEVRPEVWTEAGFLREIAAGRTFEAAEGLWIRRPWIRSAACPARPEPAPAQGAGDMTAAATPPAARREELGGTPPAPSSARSQPPAETLGLVELFDADAPRSARRNGRPYELSVKVAPGQIDLSKGLRLVVEGRLIELEAGQPIACRQPDPAERPLCLIGAERTRTAITDVAGGRVLAEWTN